VRLRRTIVRRHDEDPYDAIYQFSSIESPAVPPRLLRTVPLVIHPETHSAGELRSLIAERRLSLRCQPRHRFVTVAAIMLLRALVQRRRIRRARMLVCISEVFRDHLVRDYGFPRADTVVVPNPVSLVRFSASQRPLGDPALVLVLGRIAARKGLETVVATAKELQQRDAPVRIRVVGGPSLWSDYTALLDDLPAQNAEYAGAIAGSEIPAELARADLLVQASHYEPFALTVAEALASGVPVIATSEVGAIERVERSVCACVAPADANALTASILEMRERMASDAPRMRAAARQQAERLFAPEIVCEQISTALERLVASAPVHAPAKAA
ncbi:MAG TPA: glycosyltransferase, partial [Solirubrobacteraceae bacterium]|nr:glycosyltransferase [Solirubrobacteraceae bacterium]